MELTWIAIAASLLMGGGALLIFIWAVRERHFHGIEDVKYQVFWSDHEGPAAKAALKAANGEQPNGSGGQGN
jgi:cbb3-type cytochrome oxidase maturation protein